MFNLTTDEIARIEASAYQEFETLALSAPEISDSMDGHTDFFMPFSHSALGEYYSEGYGVVYEC